MTALVRDEVQETTEQRTLFVAPRPITYAEFLELFDENDDVELTNGVAVQRMAAQLDHESLAAWLLTVLNYCARKRHLGVVLGSRVAVRISEHSARLPDLLFVREDRREILKTRGIEGAPDLVIELVSPGDRPSDLIALEADYQSIAVEEIVFIDRRCGQIRILRRSAVPAPADSYTQELVGPDGIVRLSAFPGLILAAVDLLGNARPEPYEIIEAFLAENPEPGDVSS